jgi:hypothetical protein
MQQLSLGLEQFTGNLPNKPYCTDDLHLGLQIRPKHLALLKRYIQPNHPITRISLFLIWTIQQHTLISFIQWWAYLCLI